MVAYAQIQHKKQPALWKINTLVFLKTLSRIFYGPLSQTIFQSNSEPRLSTSKSNNQSNKKAPTENHPNIYV